MRRLKEDEAAAGKIQEAGRIEREQLQRDYEARLKAKEAALAAATEGKELLARRLDEELQVRPSGVVCVCVLRLRWNCKTNRRCVYQQQTS